MHRVGNRQPMSHLAPAKRPKRSRSKDELRAGAPAVLIGQCDNCGAELRVEAEERTANCPYCDAPSVVARPPGPARPDPTFVLGFMLDKGRATEIIRRWIESKALFARSGFRHARAEKTRGVYLPVYLYGAEAHTEYSALIGEDYTETYRTTDSKGNRVTRTRTATEWHELRGVHSTYVTDRVVTASRGMPNDELEAIEPFDFGNLTRYSPAMISGWIAEEPSVDPATCRRMAREEAHSAIGRVVGSFMPGDHHRNLQTSVHLRREHLELMLAPVWVFSVRYDEKRDPVRILVNGQTGACAGKVPYSWIKITLAVLLGLALVVGAVVTVQSRWP